MVKQKVKRFVQSKYVTASDSCLGLGWVLGWGIWDLKFRVGSILNLVVLVVVVVGLVFEKSLPQASLTPIDFLVRFIFKCL